MTNPVDEKQVNNMVQIPLEVEKDYMVQNGIADENCKTKIDYNVDEVDKKKRLQVKASYKHTVVNLFKAFVGSGVIAMPFAFHQGGFVLSSLVFVLIALLVNYSSIIVIRLQDSFCNNRENSGYSEMIEFALGKKGVVVSRFFIIVMQWGCCISYIIFFMRFFEYAFYQSDKPPIERQLIYLSFALCIILPMTLINNVAVFAKISALANVLIIMTLTFLISFAGYYIYQRTPDFEEAKYNLINIQKLPTVIGVGIYAFESVGILLTLKSSMKLQEKFLRLVQIVTLAVVVLNIVFSTITSLGFGKNTNQIVLFSLPQGRLDVAIIQICYAVALAMTFPLQILPAFQLIERIQRIQDFIKVGQDHYLLRRTFVRVVQILIICFIALGIPEFAVFLSFIGGMGGSALQFFFPLLAYFQVLWPKADKSERILFTTSMSIGIILGAYAMVASFIELVSY